MKKAFVKKLVSVVLCLAMTMTVLAGCSKTQPDDTKPTSEPTQSAATEAPTAEPTKTPDQPAATDAPTPTEAPAAEPTVIRYGTHWVAGLDPNNVDDVTGEYTMAENERQAGLAALKAVKDELNVEFEFVQYAQDTRVELMTSVLAGDPVCEIANIWGGAESTILAQNVLQPIDQYAYLFDDDQTSWMLDPQVYGHN